MMQARVMEHDGIEKPKDGWRLVTCPGGKEEAAAQILARLGYSETFYPWREVDARPRSKRNRATCTAPRRVRRAWVPGYVFVRCDWLDMFTVCRTHGTVTLRVIAPGGVPYRVTDEQMAHMAQVPDRVRELVEAARAAERAAWEAKRPVVGAPGRVTQGAFRGRVATVSRIEGGKCTLDLDLPVSVPEIWVERAA